MTSNKKKLFGILSVNLGMLLMGMCFGLLLRPKHQQPGPVMSGAVIQDMGGAQLSSGESKGVKLTSRKLATSEYAANGVTSQAESAYTLTASVYPEDAAGTLDWSAAFTNAGSAWATGKKVADYVTVMPSSNGGLTAVVENKAAFGEQITVKVTSSYNSEVYATCSVEYLQRTESYDVSLKGPDVDVNFSTTGTKIASVRPVFMATRNTTITININKAKVYTIENTDKADYFTLEPESSFVTAITTAGLISSEVKSYASTGKTLTIGNFFDKTWLSGISGSTAEKKNQLIETIDGYKDPAYRLSVYTEKGGELIYNFAIRFDSSVLVGNKFMERIEVNENELIF